MHNTDGDPSTVKTEPVVEEQREGVELEEEIQEVPRPQVSINHLESKSITQLTTKTKLPSCNPLLVYLPEWEDSLVKSAGANLDSSAEEDYGHLFD